MEVNTEDNNVVEVNNTNKEKKVEEIQELSGKSYWVRMYRESLLKKEKVQKTNRTVKYLRKNLSVFVEVSAMAVLSFGFNE